MTNKDQLDQLHIDKHPEQYAGELTGKTAYHVMVDPKTCTTLTPSGVMGRGNTLEQAVDDFHRRYDMEHNS